jgi:hypothetical protein
MQSGCQSNTLKKGVVLEFEVDFDKKDVEGNTISRMEGAILYFRGLGDGNAWQEASRVAWTARGGPHVLTFTAPYEDEFEFAAESIARGVIVEGDAACYATRPPSCKSNILTGAVFMAAPMPPTLKFIQASGSYPCSVTLGQLPTS